jgi:hypothetical protein
MDVTETTQKPETKTERRLMVMREPRHDHGGAQDVAMRNLAAGAAAHPPPELTGVAPPRSRSTAGRAAAASPAVGTAHVPALAGQERLHGQVRCNVRAVAEVAELGDGWHRPWRASWGVGQQHVRCLDLRTIRTPETLSGPKTYFPS